jgi:glycosyltransferase involved in cell wall biosynthesis
MTNPLVSIITPTYNHEKFIAECIESVLAQTFPGWEMIIIDDASTDNTPYIIEKYVKNEPRIKFIRHNTNWGMYRLANTYNQALELSQGVYIAILEGDDFWPLNKISIQLPLFNDDEAVLTYGKCWIISPNSERNFVSPLKNYYRNKNQLFKELVLFKNCIPAVTVMIKKCALEKIEGFHQPFEIPVVDYPTWLELLFLGEFLGINEILGYYRWHSTSQSILKYGEIVEKKKYVVLRKTRNKNFNYYLQKNRISIQRIINRQTSLKINSYWLKGRYYLTKRDIKKAFHEFFIGLLIKPNIKSIIGILFGCVLRVNIEKIINFLKRRKKSFIEVL